MRLNKRELSQKLGISESAITTWQRQGMPVLEHGSRGKPGVYDLAAVVRWMRQTGYGSRAQNPAYRVDLDALERELEARHSPAPAALPPFPDPRSIAAIEEASGQCLVEAAAWMVKLFKIEPRVAIHCAEIFVHEQCSAFESVHGFGTGPNFTRGDMVAANGDQAEVAALAERVRARADAIEEDDLGVYEGFFFDEEGNPT